MKLVKFLLLLIIMSSTSFSNIKSAYDFEFKSITGENLKLKNFENKVLLVVNVASNCGFTKQYAGLQKIWDNYKSKGLVVIGIPSNDFNQELNSKEEVKKFCETNFSINFPMTDITNVKGPEAHPFYIWAKQTYGSDTIPKWNFYKILIDKNGKIVDTFSSLTKPDSNKLISAIEKIL
jgi:glutathione peroxidase